MVLAWRTVQRLAIAVFWVLEFPLALAQEVAPDALVKRISDEVIAAIRQDKELQAGNPAKIHALVEAKVLPHFDSRRATQLAMGANWRRATPEQQEELVREFRTLLVRTYSGALANYRDQVIELRPTSVVPGDTEATVRSVVRQSGAEPIAIEYDMAKSESGWRVFDVRVGGISLVANYRTAFAEEVRNRGIEGLISLLSNKNRQGGVKPAALTRM
jgi:phospholipid transport system substrate-binding protein